jgi:predicted nucleotidyltransferase
VNEELERYVLAHRERDARQRSSRQAEAWRVVRRAARRLRRQAGVRRVLVFGSLVRGKLHEQSDIDLAVEGLDPRRYFEALAQVQDLGPFEVQLAPLEHCRPHIRAAILREGVEL